MVDEYQIRSYLLNLLKITPKSIELILENNYEHLRQRDLYFELREYLDEFLEKPNQNKFFVIPGLRGVGKSTLLYQLYDYLHNTKEISANRILLLDLELLKDEKNLNIKDYFNVFIKEINEEYYLTDKPLFIFVDESQYDSNWDSAGKLVYDEHVNVFIIFTGSNALNLSYNADAARRLIRKELYPLNFIEYLEIKYGMNLPNTMQNSIYSLLITADIKEAQKLEKQIQIEIQKNLPTDINLEWEKYIQYGTLPFGLNKNPIEIVQQTLDIKDRIIEKDFPLTESLNNKTRMSAYPLLKQLAMQKPGEITYNSLANLLDLDIKTVKNLLSTLEKTELIYHYDKYASSSSRIRSSYEYYFLATQVKAAYLLSNGDVSNDYKQYMGILLENLVGTSLYKLKRSKNDGFGVYYDNKKGGVDFILKTFNQKVIPIEVGIGRKNKKQITNAIKRYNCEYGIVISNKTDYIIKEDNIIFIPVKTFSFI